jgi:hypothetical protein
MIHEIESLFEAARQAAGLILDRAVSVDLWWVVAGVVVYELSQVVRTRGWFNILRAAYPHAAGLRARDVAGAYLAGSGLNSVLPARTGDFLKLFMVHRRMPESRYSTLFDSLCGAALVIWALARGFIPVPVTATELPELDVSFIIFHPLLSAIGAAVLAFGVVMLVRWIRPRARGLGARVRQGFAILRSPRQFVLGVVSWQALSRLIRLGGLACFMAAFGLPVTLNTAILVMASQGAGRIIPIAPVSAGLRVAMLTYGFVEVTDTAVDVASITSFWFVVGAAHLIASVAIAIVVIAITFRTVSLRHALASARAGARKPDRGATRDARRRSPRNRRWLRSPTDHRAARSGAGSRIIKDTPPRRRAAIALLPRLCEGPSRSGDTRPLRPLVSAKGELPASELIWLRSGDFDRFAQRSPAGLLPDRSDPEHVVVRARACRSLLLTRPATGDSASTTACSRTMTIVVRRGRPPRIPENGSSVCYQAERGTAPRPRGDAT